MWIWIQLICALVLGNLQGEGKSISDTGVAEINNDTLCFNVKKEACTHIQRYWCNCKALGNDTTFCCNFDPSVPAEQVSCAGIHPRNLRFLHIINLSSVNLKRFGINIFKKLESLSITGGKIEQISPMVLPKLNCLNISNNSISQIQEGAFDGLPKLAILDLSKNNLTNLPNLINKNISLDISDNGGVDCQMLRQFLTENPQTTFINGGSTYCSSSKNFHWFNSTEQVPLSQFFILKNIHQNCTKGCSCSSHRLDMVSGKHPTISVFVNCASLGLRKLPEYLPTNTISLNVSNNKITSLDLLSFDESYKDIREFYADYNQITSILALEGSKFIDNFLVLSLRENNIKSLPTYILSNTFDRNYHTRRVNLAGNRIVCNCSVAQVTKVWLLSNKKHIPDYDQVLCDNTGEKVITLDQNKVCIYPNQRDWTDYIYYIIAGEVVLFFLLVAKVSYDYWVFKTAGYLPWPASKMPKLPCDWVLE